MDFAGLGNALPDRVQYYKVREMKRMGVNAWRCAHNPPAPEFLDACDELGLSAHKCTRSRSTGFL
jgi:beta-galactosidase